MKILNSELKRIGATVFQLRRLWYEARRGDRIAQRRLLEITLLVPKSHEFLKDLALQREQRLSAFKDKKSNNKKNNLTQWERARENLGKNGARVIAGGLPSLGKKAK